MPRRNNRNNNDSNIYEEPFECVICSGLVSADRPPFLNLDNCSCAQHGAIFNDPDIALQSAFRGLTIDNAPHPHHAFSTPPPLTQNSYSTSEDGPVKVQEGPESRDPNNRFEPLAPAVGLGEYQHRLIAAFDTLDSTISYSLRRYLISYPPPESPDNDSAIWESAEEEHHAWLRQDQHLMGPAGAASTVAFAPTKGKSSPEVDSMMVSTWGDGSGSGSGSGMFDPTRGVGDWAEDSGSGSGYASGSGSGGGWHYDAAIEEDLY